MGAFQGQVRFEQPLVESTSAVAAELFQLPLGGLHCVWATGGTLLPAKRCAEESGGPALRLLVDPGSCGKPAERPGDLAKQTDRVGAGVQEPIELP